jgi:hypothetical protein
MSEYVVTALIVSGIAFVVWVCRRIEARDE